MTTSRNPCPVQLQLLSLSNLPHPPPPPSHYQQSGCFFHLCTRSHPPPPHHPTPVISLSSGPTTWPKPSQTPTINFSESEADHLPVCQIHPLPPPLTPHPTRSMILLSSGTLQSVKLPQSDRFSQCIPRIGSGRASGAEGSEEGVWELLTKVEALEAAAAKDRLGNHQGKAGFVGDQRPIRAGNCIEK
jgi:hypothetical protein